MPLLKMLQFLGGCLGIGVGVIVTICVLLRHPIRGRQMLRDFHERVRRARAAQRLEAIHLRQGERDPAPGAY